MASCQPQRWPARPPAVLVMHCLLYHFQRCHSLAHFQRVMRMRGWTAVCGRQPRGAGAGRGRQWGMRRVLSWCRDTRWWVLTGHLSATWLGVVLEEVGRSGNNTSTGTSTTQALPESPQQRSPSAVQSKSKVRGKRSTTPMMSCLDLTCLSLARADVAQRVPGMQTRDRRARCSQVRAWRRDCVWWLLEGV